MSRLQPQLAAMFSLAEQRTDSARVELAGKLSDVFLQDQEHLSLREQELVNELIDQLLVASNRTPTLRRMLVEKFADKVKMPRKIAMSLATAPIDDARDVLTLCETLSDEDLITVVGTQSTDHAAAVAHRASIREAVVDALITTNDLQVMQIVAENLGAKISEKALKAMADTARFSAALREPILKRPEMTKETAARLYWWVSQDLRRYAMKQFGLAAPQIDAALAKTLEELLSYHELDKGNDKIMQQVADWLQERDVISARLLPQVLRLGHFRLFNIMLARLTKLEQSLVDMIVAETGGRGLAVVCRSLGIDKAGFVSFFLLSRAGRDGEHVVHPRELSFALAAFDKLSVSLAYDLLRSWQQNPGYLLSKQAHDLVLEA